MQNNAVTALIKMNTFAVLLCSVLLVLGNLGLTSSLPLFVMGKFDIIHAGFFLALTVCSWLRLVACYMAATKPFTHLSILLPLNGRRW